MQQPGTAFSAINRKLAEIFTNVLVYTLQLQCMTTTATGLCWSCTEDGSLGLRNFEEWYPQQGTIRGMMFSRNCLVAVFTKMQMVSLGNGKFMFAHQEMCKHTSYCMLSGMNVRT